MKDVLDYIWEARRMRRLKAAAMHAELSRAASDQMTDTSKKEKDLDHTTAHSHLEYLMRGSVAGGEGC